MIVIMHAVYFGHHWSAPKHAMDYVNILNG